MTGREQQAAHSSFWCSSDFMVALAAIIALVLHVAVPIRFPDFVTDGWLDWVRLGLGVFLALWGLSWIAGSKRDLAEAQQPTAPGHPTTELVTSGNFQLSRNPMYVGLLAVLAAAGLIASVPWFLLLTPVLAYAFYLFLIRPEETYLKNKFPEEFNDWSNKVRRWM